MEYRSYSITVRKSGGTIGTKYIDAPDEASARAEAERYGSVLRVTVVKTGKFAYWLMKWRRRRGFKRHKRMEFLQTMSNMLVGYTLGEALSVMSQNFTGVIRDASNRLRQYAITDQKDPVDALAMLGTKYIPSVTLAIIRSNAKVGRLNEAFREGLDFEREVGKLQSSQALAMQWAIFKFLGAMILTILTWLYGFALLEDFNYFDIIPEEGDAKESMDDIALYLDWMGISGSIVMGLWFSIIVIIGVGRDLKPTLVEKWILHLPLLRGAMLNRKNFLTAYQVNKLMSKGVTLTDTFQYVNEDLEAGVLKDDIERVMEAFERGDPEWVDSFHSFTDLDRALLKSADRQEEIAAVFEAQSDQFLTGYERSINYLVWAHNIIGGLYMFVLVLVLTLVMFLPMLGGFALVNQAS